MAEAFVYCWTDHKDNKLYIGSHKGSVDDGYICSSKLVKEQYHLRPQDFSREILYEGSWNEMFKLEGKLLKDADAKNNDSYYNQHNGSGDFRNKHQSSESREKISKAKLGILRTEETKRKISLSRMGNIPWNKGKFTSEETKEKIRIARAKQIITVEDKIKMSAAGRGRIFSDEHKRRISVALEGIPLSEERKKNISISLKGRTAWNKGNT